MKLTDMFSKDEFVERCIQLPGAAALIYEAIRRHEAVGRKVAILNSYKEDNGVWRFQGYSGSPLSMVLDGCPGKVGDFFSGVGRALGITAMQADSLDDGIKNNTMNRCPEAYQVGKAINQMIQEAAGDQPVLSSRIAYL